MPAHSVTSLAREDGPAILMETADHAKTASFGNSRAARAYRHAQKDLVDQGRIRDAVEMDIKDIRSKFGNKYDSAIRQLLDSLDR
jgi:hypothetical protein